jgi:hypothetical protein
MAAMSALDRARPVRVLVGILLVSAVVVAGIWSFGNPPHGERSVDLVSAGPPPVPDVPFRTGVLTPDGGDTYDVGSGEGVAVIEAPGSNTGTNLRTVLWRDTDTVSADQQSCATFDSADPDQQPGIALRIRSAGGRTQAITVTKNVWFGYYARFNVHVMDSAATEPYRQIGSVDLSSTFLLPDGGVRPYPWRMCALVVGDTVRFVAWPASETPPAWDDPAYGGSARLPAGWQAPGRPGLYAGHLQAGHSLEYRSVSTQPL